MSHNSQQSILLKQALPYINKYRGKCFIFVVSPALIKKQPENNHLGKDLAMCHSLGIRCVLCVDEAATKKDKPIQAQEMDVLLSQYAPLYAHANIFVTRGAYELGHRPHFMQGNWILARPQGIIDGVNMQRCGRVRRIAGDAMLALLAQGYVLFTLPLVADKQGIFYLLSCRNMVAELVRTLGADKVITYQADFPDAYRQKAVPRAEATAFMEQAKSSVQPVLADMIHYCDMGAKRAHLIPAHKKDALVNELLTAQGYGLMVNADSYEELIAPRFHEMETIKALIAPLEKEGLLRPRSLAQLQEKTEDFRVLKRDDNIVCCAALSPVGKGYAELECVVVKKSYAGRGYGTRVLNSMENLAASQGYKNLVVLTTQAVEWFQEKGFKPTSKKLPVAEFCCARNAKMLVKKIGGA